MLCKTTLLALAAASAAQAAVPQGFNYGSTMNGGPVSTSQFEQQFKGAAGLAGAPGSFNAARLYTMLGSDGTSLIPALEAAQNTQTYLLLGLWASGASSGFDNEVSALKTATTQYPDLAKYILGISVGSEDLYRISPPGLQSPEAGPGNSPDNIVSYINRVRDTIKGSSWSNIKVGHVDTWTAWVNGSNSQVIDNSDFLGVDAYPYFQNTQENSIQNAANLFNEALDNTRGVSNGKDVWITETGWPITGPTKNLAQADLNDAQTYWNAVACANLGKVPTFWYTLYDGVAPTTDTNGTPSFSVADSTYKPLFDLSCKNVTSNSTSTSTSSSGTSTGSASSSTGTGSASGSGANNGTYTGTPSQPTGSSSGSSSGSSGSGSSGSGSGSSSASASGSKGSSTAIATSGASSLTMSLGSMAAVAAAVVALL